jgi:hypothetical protein
VNGRPSSTVARLDLTRHHRLGPRQLARRSTERVTGTSCGGAVGSAVGPTRAVSDVHDGIPCVACRMSVYARENVKNE